MKTRTYKGWTGIVLMLAVVGCSPTVMVAAPEKPIVINMNIKIEHNIRIKINKDVDELIHKEQSLF
jgi:hypothetical protein